jgi:hypothetical protein
MKIATKVLGTLTTGMMLTTPFSKIHEAAEWIMGQPIFTHNFANEAVQKELVRRILLIVPDMPVEIKGGAWEVFGNALVDKYGEFIDVPKGGDAKVALSAGLEHLNEDAEIVVVKI